MSIECAAKKPRFEAVVSLPGGFPADRIPLHNKKLPEDSIPGADYAANGISPDCDDWDDGADEPILFSGPDRELAGAPAIATSPDTPARDSATSEDRPPRVSAIRRREPHVSGAVTTLRSLKQLEAVFGAEPLPAAGEAADPAGALRLRAGESVFVVLHNGQAPVDAATAELSQARVFLLNLSALPPREYEDPGRLHGDSPGGGVVGPLRFSAAEQGTLPLSFSSQIAHCTERVLRHVGAALRVDEVLCPEEQNDATQSQSQAGAVASQTSLTATQKRGRREELTLPSMVLWRANGGPEDEYAPSKERDVSSSNAYGRPLVVKQLTAVDQLHSLSLLAPVYTLEHLLRTVAKAALGAQEVNGSRTLIYFGASWCPPCMRIVNALPVMMKEDIPKNVACTVKADMDLATPIFEFFGVEIIPTFIVLDNDILRSTKGWTALPSGEPIPVETFEALREGLKRSELGRLQCSQRLLVRSFIEKFCKGLSFDEDF